MLPFVLIVPYTNTHTHTQTVSTHTYTNILNGRYGIHVPKERGMSEGELFHKLRNVDVENVQRILGFWDQ